MVPLHRVYDKVVLSNTNYQMEVSTMYLLFHGPSRKGKRIERRDIKQGKGVKGNYSRKVYLIKQCFS